MGSSHPRWGMAISIVLVLLMVGILLWATSFSSSSEKANDDCMTGEFLIQSDYGLVVIGDVQVCGKGLRLTGVYGPSFEAWLAPSPREK